MPARRPCSSSFILVTAATLAGSTLFASPALAASPSWCGKGAETARTAAFLHREERERRGPVRATAVLAPATRVGQIAVMQDEGDLALLRHEVDLQGVGVSISPDGSTYSVARVDRPISGGSGTKLILGDDATAKLALPFSFPFHGKSWSEVFVNSDGNLTFGEGDDASTARSIGRLVLGPPRIAPMLADLDPSAGGSVTTTSDASKLTVTWSKVPRFDESDANSFEVTLHSDGIIEMTWATELSSTFEEAVTGIAPGQEQGGITPVDFSNPGGAISGGALAESFRSTDSLDTVAVARKFYTAFPDEYMQLVVFTSRRLTGPSTFAFEETVKTSEDGIGQQAFDASAEYGSGGRLESFVDMDAIGKYPDDFVTPLLGEESALSILAHETGHRWLVKARFDDSGKISAELLGRQQAHWSFFVDSNGSHLEGNDIQDLGGGQFKTGEHSFAYSEVDQYLMGLRGVDEVPPFFFVRQPSGLVNSSPERGPALGASFGGTRVDVSMAQIVSALGPRKPAVGQAPNAFRQAYVFVAIGGPADSNQVAKVDRFRSMFPDFYARSTGGRGSVSATLD